MILKSEHDGDDDDGITVALGRGGRGLTRTEGREGDDRGWGVIGESGGMDGERIMNLAVVAELGPSTSSSRMGDGNDSSMLE